jgi:hypothetical protein
VEERSNRRMENGLLHDQELHNLYSSANIIRVIKSRRVSFVRHVACMGDM